MSEADYKYKVDPRGVLSIVTAPNTPTRASTLDEAKAAVTGQRQSDYGTLEDNFKVIAGLWSVFLGTEVTAMQVAPMMALLKVARIKSNPTHHDSYVDIAGYAACGAELASKQVEAK